MERSMTKTPVIPDLNTRFARPIVDPKTGEHVSAETLYNRCCADLGRVQTDHIGDLILDNLSYGTPMGEVDTKEMCDAIYAWADRVRALISPRKGIQFPNKNMSVVENQIVERLVTDILAAGLTVSVYDGEDYPLRHSTSLEAIMDALASTDNDELVLHEPMDRCGLRMRKGWVSLIWGNDTAVISDYTTNIEHILRGVNAMADHMDCVDRGYRKPFAPNTTARFWVCYGSSYVRIKLRKGQELACSEGGQTDEGFSYTGHSWSFDGEEVTYNTVTNASDCDGPISHGYSAFCKLDELKAIRNEDDTHSFPHWQERGKGWQRDHNAEAAGY